MVDPAVSAEASVAIADSSGTIYFVKHPTFIGTCSKADVQVYTQGFADPRMTFTVEGDGRLSSQTLIDSDTYTTVAAGGSTSGELVVTATSVEKPNVTASATLRIDPLVGAYGVSRVQAGSGLVSRNIPEHSRTARSTYRTARRHLRNRR